MYQTLPRVSIRRSDVPVTTAMVDIDRPVGAFLRSSLPPTGVTELPLRMPELRETQPYQCLTPSPPLQTFPPEHLFAQTGIRESQHVPCPSKRSQAKKCSPGVDTQGEKNFARFPPSPAVPRYPELLRESPDAQDTRCHGPHRAVETVDLFDCVCVKPPTAHKAVGETTELRSRTLRSGLILRFKSSPWLAQ